MPSAVKLKTLAGLLAATLLVACNGDGPNIEVFLKHGERGASEIVQDIPHVTIKSRDEQPVLIKSILINNDQDCQSFMGMPMPSPFPATLKMGQMVSVISACEPVQIVVSTDRGDATFTFR